MHFFSRQVLHIIGAFALVCAPFAPRPLIAAPAAPLAETVVRLDQVDVTTDKGKHFSLPLDATPATASRLGLANRDLPASVSVITQEVIQLRGFRTAVEAVEGAVGMTGGTAFGSIPNFSARGFSGNNVTVLRDGLRQNTASQSSRTVDSFNLDRVEILKGPASLMFGEGAVGGAVNYVSKSPDRSPRADALLSYGAWDTVRLGVGAGGPLPGEALFFRADLSHQRTDGYVDRNAQRYTGFTGALGWDVSAALKLTVFTTWLEDHVESYYGNPVLYDAVDRYDPATGTYQRLVARAVTATDRLVNPRVDASARRTNYNITDNYADTENTFHRLRAEWTPAPDWEVRNEAYLATQLLKWRNLETNQWNPATQLVDRTSFVHIYRDDQLTGNRLDVTSRRELLGRPNRFVIGGSFERNALLRGGAPADYPTTLASVSLLDPVVGSGPGDPDRFLKTARVRIDTTAFFVEDALDLTPSLKLVAGLRHDTIALRRAPLPAGPVFKKRYTPLTGRAGLVWAVNPRINLYGSYSHAAEPVTQLVSLTTTQNDFSLQQGRQFEIGAKGSLAAGRIDFTVALFDIEKNDLLTSTLDPITGVRINQQIGAQVSQGAELSVAWLPARDWRLEGNLAWTWQARFEDFNENLGTGVVSRAGNLPANIPEWVASAYLTKTFGPRWLISGGPRYVDRRAANNANLIWTPAYTTLEASVTYLCDRWSFTLRGRNLLDETYEEWATSGGLMQRLADPVNAEVSARYRF